LILYDKGKPRVITKFSIEKAGAHPIVPAPEVERPAEEKARQPNAPTMIAPDHFAAYFFDEIHPEIAYLAQARMAAQST
jgi:hypothetical protein